MSWMEEPAVTVVRLAVNEVIAGSVPTKRLAEAFDSPPAVELS